MKPLSEHGVGDRVALKTGTTEHSYAIYPISAIQVRKNGYQVLQISTGAQFRATDGLAVSRPDSYSYRTHIEVVTPEIEAIVRKNKLVGKLSALDYNKWQEIEIEKLEAVAKILWGDK